MYIKPIETLYKGYKFRSRLEARWAVFFDVLGIKWHYEIEGYETPHGRYLPDFWLPDTWTRYTKLNGVYLEVKPDDWGYEHNALAYVANANDAGAVLANGMHFEKEPFWRDFIQVAPDWDNCMMFYVCSNCGNLRLNLGELEHILNVLIARARNTLWQDIRFVVLMMWQ